MSDDDDENYFSDNGKRKNVVTSTLIKHGTKVAKFLALLTNDFDLIYSEAKTILKSNSEAYHLHTLDQCRKFI